MNNSMPFILCFFSVFLSSHLYDLAGGKQLVGSYTVPGNPFSPKATLIRYWNRHIHGGSPKSAFLLSKASPLTAANSSRFASLAARHALHTRRRDFCFAAKLFCFPDLSPSQHKHDSDKEDDGNFALYGNKNFTTYGSDRLAGADSFKNYSAGGDNIAVGSFRRYSHDSAGHGDGFSNYADDGNVAVQSFRSYGAESTGGSGDFLNYQNEVNEPNSRFTSYSGNANGRSQSFSAYSVNSNDGIQTFTRYSKKGNGAPNEFSGYGTESNLIQSGFSAYGRAANMANDTFVNYGTEGNIPANEFRSYGNGGNGAVYSFKRYRDKANMGTDSFSSYVKNSNIEKVNFVNYGNSFNLGSDNFTSYGQGAAADKIEFKTYRQDPNFKKYSGNDVVFARYINAAAVASARAVNKWVETGKFFRESTLKEGNLMQMPDIQDKMPKRTFLPRAIVSKLPFSTSYVKEIMRIFGAGENSTAAEIISAALKECERPPSRGETKRCVGSAEDMIDFATSVLGHHVAVRTTENVRGSKGQIMIGKVRGINGGNVTRSVSCHQSMYPYLLYYCHSVPRVRVYESDILDPKSRVKINYGVAICHLDTSAWSAGHGAFLALGPGPGQIEVCHWIFENDMTWTVAD